MYGSNDTTFGKKQYYEGSKEISGCQELGVGKEEG